LTSNVNNLVEDGSCSPALSGDPKLGGLANNGGTTPTFAPLAGSAAIDAGNPLTCKPTDQRGYPRPQDGNADGLAVCDIGSVEKLRSLTFRSVGTQDGWVLESSENSSVGGSLNSTLTTVRLGDDALNRQYRGILSFNTVAIPDTAVVPRILLKVQQQSITGANPFLTHGSLLVDIRRGVFGGGAALQTGDFSAVSNLNAAGAFNKNPLAGSWYQAVLKPTASPYINKTGVTQLRLRFQLDDNNDLGADYLSIFSGDNGTIASRPLLYIEYYIP
ncbi:MAG TPA: choice-of-anchor Q domain-containing protein, partial [Anaerolineales bacterium]